MLKFERLFKVPVVYRSCFLSFSNSIRIPEYDLEYMLNPSNKNEIETAIRNRKGIGDISKVFALHEQLNAAQKAKNEDDILIITHKLYKELSLIPNKIHPEIKNRTEKVKVLKLLNSKPDFGKGIPFDFAEITRKLNIMRTSKLGNQTGNRSYYLMHDLAELEEALVKYTVTFLLDKGFQLISVPDILPTHVLEGCGMKINEGPTQIYSLDVDLYGPGLHLSGTSEMGLAGMLMQSTFDMKALPLKFVAVSRCYRAEISNVVEERGIYRVHEFTKVEMFAVTKEDQSEEVLENFRETQENLFKPLGIHMQVLDMPPSELGASAYRKYDMEAWMPGRKLYGEISSCSNCTDYQSRRLTIKYKTSDGKMKYVHTVNGTGCAIPRMLIALLETHQNLVNGTIEIPVVLQPFFSKKEIIKRQKAVPDLKMLLSKLKL